MILEATEQVINGMLNMLNILSFEKKNFSKLCPENTSLLEENSYCSFWTIVISLCDAFIVEFYSILSFWQYITRI